LLGAAFCCRRLAEAALVFGEQNTTLSEGVLEGRTGQGRKTGKDGREEEE
jgi:hypothetical protein